MKLRTSSAWATSLSLHCLMLALAVFTWKVKPIINPSPEIPVSIISDVASSVGKDANEGDTTQEIAKATSPEPEPETKQEIAPEPAPAPIAAPPPAIVAPKPKPQPKAPPPPPIVQPKPQPKAPPPPPIAQPKPQPKAPPPPAPTPKQIARPQPTPAPSPKKITPPTRAQTAPAPSVARPSPPAAKAAPPANTNPFGNFDLAAATRASSGVDAGGRRAPQMAKSTGSSSRGRGQGTRLQGDLANALRQQIKPCWREPADLSGGQSLVVVVAMELREDGNLARPPRLISPSSRNGANSSLLVAIDNALRAARQCAPYDLPADRYDDWKTFEFRFDPRELRSP